MQAQAAEYSGYAGCLYSAKGVLSRRDYVKVARRTRCLGKGGRGARIQELQELQEFSGER
jgi:hypothetical protein